MIVRMKEILLFASAKSISTTVQQLGKLGVVDIKEVRRPSGDVLERRAREVERTEKVISILEAYAPGKASRAALKEHLKDPKRLADRVLFARHLKQECLKKLETYRPQLDWYETWGENTKKKDLALLRDHGIYIRLYRVNRAQVEALSEAYNLAVFQERDEKVPVALITRDPAERLPLKEEDTPALPLSEVREQIKRKERQIDKIEAYLKEKSAYLPAFHDYLAILRDRKGIQEVVEGMGDIEGAVRYLKGYVPRDDVDAFVEAAKENAWGYRITDPENPEDVPVHVKNPKWISIINPVMKFIDIVPGYKEVDVSIYFLIAFALFFAMLVGDAGYGALFLVLIFIFRKKLSPQMRVLAYVLSGATVVWGVLSGTYFGSEEIAAIPVLNNLIIENISSFGVDNINFMMHLSFLIGAIHLTVAHGIRIVQFINSIRLLSEVGWIGIVWGLYFLAENLVLGKAMPGYTLWLFAGGAALVTLFSMESKSFVQSMLVSIGNLPLSLINGFSDIVSYVRLFAVGLATATVAASFNNMIVPDGFGGMSFLNLIIAAIALLLGHGLNIALALMAVLVHGIRLNMLEFAGHVGVDFSGVAYKPFRLHAPLDELEDVGQE